MTSGGGGDGQQGVAVGIGFGDDLGADIAAGAGAVVDDDRLAPFARQPIGDDARHDIGGAAGGKRHDEFHRARRIILRPCRVRESETERAMKSPSSAKATRARPRRRDGAIISAGMSSLSVKGGVMRRDLSQCPAR